VALALVLVVGAGLLASSLTRLYRSGEGFDPRGVENVAFSMDKSGMDHDAVMDFYHDMGEGLSHLPGSTECQLRTDCAAQGRNVGRGLCRRH
jgi:hypothetical protein